MFYITINKKKLWPQYNPLNTNFATQFKTKQKKKH